MSQFGTAHPVFTWWLFTTLITIAGLPVTFSIFRWFHTRGLILARITSWFIWSYIAWILVSLGILEYSVETLIISLVFLAMGSALVLILEGKSFLETVKQKYSILLIGEGIFLVLFIVLCVFRAFNPDISQQEKEADFAFMNGILRSSTFPPVDPWMAGYPLNYFYFGFYSVANLVKISGIPPATGFNLAVAMILASATAGAFAIIYNVTKSYKWAACGSAMFGIMGNLHAFVAYTSNWAVFPFDWWRSGHDTIPNTVHEFPYWSFILGDLHAHYISLPFSILFFGLMFNLLWSKGNLGLLGQGKPYNNLHIFIATTLSYGASVSVINPWDLPAFTIILVFVAFLSARNLPDKYSVKWWVFLGVFLAVLVGLSRLFFLPMQQHFVSPLSKEYMGFVPKSLRSELMPFLTLHGFFLFVIFSYLLMKLRHFFPQQNEKRWALVLFLTFIACLLSVMFEFPVLVMLIFLILLGGFILWKCKMDDVTLTDFLLVMLGACILLGCEFIYLDKTYGDASLRYNTVFKLYYQVWIIFTIALPVIVREIWNERSEAGEKFFVSPWKVVFVFLFAISFSFAILGTYTKCNRFKTSKTGAPAWIPTLDGNAYINSLHPGEGDAIQWINKNIKGAPVMLETSGYAFKALTGGRIAANTGLPTLLGWENHENIWRRGFKDENGELMFPKINADRKSAITRIYTAETVQEILPVIEKYNIRYIFVGHNERETHPGPGLQKFKTGFKEVYANNHVSIYQTHLK